MHHGLIDGYGFIHIIDKLTGNTSPYLVHPERESLFQNLNLFFNAPKILITFARQMAKTPDIFCPLKKSPQNTTWFISLQTLNLNVFKKVRRLTSTHFHSVVMSMVIGALRRHLQENEKDVKIPQSIITASSLPWPNHPRTTLLNHWSGGVFKIPFKTEDPLERIYGAENSYKYRHSHQLHKVVKRVLHPVTWCLPSSFLLWAKSKDMAYFRYSNTVAPLMLSEKPYYLLGKRVKQLFLPLAIKDTASTCG